LAVNADNDRSSDHRSGPIKASTFSKSGLLKATCSESRDFGPIDDDVETRTLTYDM
jgi:hypothetical protein